MRSLKYPASVQTHSIKTYIDGGIKKDEWIEEILVVIS